MQAEGVQMNMVAYTALIDAHARNGNMDQASALLKQMEKDGCQPNTITYSNLVKGHCVRGDLGEALRVFREMLDRGLAADAVIFNTMLDGCVRHGHYELADRLLDDMGKYQVEPSNFTLSIVVKMWGKRKHLNNAFEAVRDALRKPRGGRVDPLVGACLVGACLHNRNPDRALEALDEIKAWSNFDGPCINTYGALICGLARHGRLHKACEITEEACGIGPGAAARPAHKGPAPGLNADPLRQVFKALIQGGYGNELALPLEAKLRGAGVQIEHRWLTDYHPGGRQ